MRLQQQIGCQLYSPPSFFVNVSILEARVSLVYNFFWTSALAYLCCFNVADFLYFVTRNNVSRLKGSVCMLIK